MEFAQNQLNRLTNPKNAEMWTLRAIMVIAASMYSKRLYNDRFLQAGLFVAIGNFDNAYAIALTACVVMALNMLGGYFVEGMVGTGDNRIIQDAWKKVTDSLSTGKKAPDHIDSIVFRKSRKEAVRVANHVMALLNKHATSSARTVSAKRAAMDSVMIAITGNVLDQLRPIVGYHKFEKLIPLAVERGLSRNKDKSFDPKVLESSVTKAFWEAIAVEFSRVAADNYIRHANDSVSVGSEYNRGLHVMGAENAIKDAKRDLLTTSKYNHFAGRIVQQKINQKKGKGAGKGKAGKCYNRCKIQNGKCISKPNVPKDVNCDNCQPRSDGKVCVAKKK